MLRLKRLIAELRSRLARGRHGDCGHNDQGSASLEFVTAGIVLLVPLVYLVLVLSAIQSGSFAVEGAARQGARLFVQANTPQQGAEEAGRAVEYALADYGLPASKSTMVISCSPRPDACLTRLGRVTVTVKTDVTLPLVPQILNIHVPLVIPLSAVSTETVSRFAGTR